MINTNPRKVIKEMTGFLRGEWKSLCKEFNVDVDFYIVYADEDLRLMWNNVYRYDSAMQSAEDVIKHYTAFRNIDTIIDTAVGYVSEDGEVHQHVTLLRETFYYLIIVCMDHLDDLKEFLRISLRHEMGHCKANIDMFASMSLSDADKLFRKEYYETQKQYDEWCKEHPDATDEERTKFYYSTPQEKRANDAVGLTWDEMWKSEALCLYFDE